MLQVFWAKIKKFLEPDPGFSDLDEAQTTGSQCSSFSMNLKKHEPFYCNCSNCQHNLKDRCLFFFQRYLNTCPQLALYRETLTHVCPQS